MYTIRLYTSADLQMLQSWWLHYEFIFPEDILPANSTYILEHAGEPIMSACVFFIEGTKTCMIENAIKKPNTNVQGGLEFLFSHLDNVAKQRGCTSIILFSYLDKLKKKYADMGYTNTVNNCSFFSKLF